MTMVTVTIKARFDDELRDYITDAIMDGIPIGDVEKLEVEVEFAEEVND